jgi:CRISPR-associated protein Cmr5
MQTLEQRRAAHAWRAVQEISKEDEKAKKEYAGEAKKLPMRIQAAGLGQALAFIVAKAKDKKPHLEKLHKHLTGWAKERPLKLEKQDSLLESIILGDSAFLRRATEEMLEYLKWLNRFAEAEGLTKLD